MFPVYIDHMYTSTNLHRIAINNVMNEQYCKLSEIENIPDTT